MPIIRKGIIAALAILTLIVTTGTNANAAAWDFPVADSVPSGSTLIAVNEASYFDAWNSWNSHKRGPFIGRGPETHICPNGPDENNCNPDAFDLVNNSILPFCSSAQQENCVESLRIKKDSNEWVTATFEKMIEGTTYNENAAQNRIAGATPSLFNAPGVTNGSGSSSYAVVVRVAQRYDSATKKYRSETVNAVVVPYSTRAGGTPPAHSEQQDADGVTRVWTRHDQTCIWSGSGYCGVAEDFAPGTRVELTVRVPAELSGWFRGRITSPSAEISAFGTANKKVVLAADPVSVPRFAAYATAETTSPRGIELIKDSGGKNPNAPLFSGRSIKDFWATGPVSFELLNEFRKASNDTAAGISTLWNFSTIETANNNRCMNSGSKLLGFVSTNATVYNGQTPDFINGQLTYKVAGVHFAPDGKTMNEGTYDLLMRSDVARCLYGFSSAPISASISVVSDSGENKIASTTVTESNGWLSLRAVGFSYSSPTIKIKLTQAKRKTITCVKGKSVRKVTAVNAKCPTGYKKK